MAAIYSRGAARFRHATTGEIFTIPADALEWAEFAADERQMGTEVGYSAEIDHPALGALSWELWEYPIGAENMRETHANGHELLENIDFGLQDFPDDDEPEEDLPLALRLAALPAQLDQLDQLLAALRDRSPMIGFWGFVSTSMTGAKSRPIPQALSSAAMAFAMSHVSSKESSSPRRRIGGQTVHGARRRWTRPPS